MDGDHLIIGVDIDIMNGIINGLGLVPQFYFVAST